MANRRTKGRHHGRIAVDNIRTIHRLTINSENGTLTPSSHSAECSRAFIKRGASALTARAHTQNKDVRVGVSCCLLDVT